jgi:hypothetical protein
MAKTLVSDFLRAERDQIDLVLAEVCAAIAEAINCEKDVPEVSKIRRRGGKTLSDRFKRLVGWLRHGLTFRLKGSAADEGLGVGSSAAYSRRSGA